MGEGEREGEALRGFSEVLDILLLGRSRMALGVDTVKASIITSI